MMGSLIHEHDFEHVRDGGHEMKHLVSCATCEEVFCTLCGTSVTGKAQDMMHGHAGMACDQVVAK